MRIWLSLNWALLGQTEGRSFCFIPNSFPMIAALCDTVDIVLVIFFFSFKTQLAVHKAGQEVFCCYASIMTIIDNWRRRRRRRRPRQMLIMMQAPRHHGKEKTPTSYSKLSAHVGSGEGKCKQFDNLFYHSEHFGRSRRDCKIKTFQAMIEGKEVWSHVGKRAVILHCFISASMRARWICWNNPALGFMSGEGIQQVYGAWLWEGWKSFPKKNCSWGWAAVLK